MQKTEVETWQDFLKNLHHIPGLQSVDTRSKMVVAIHPFSVFQWFNLLNMKLKIILVHQEYGQWVKKTCL